MNATDQIRKAYNTYQTLPDANRYMAIGEIEDRTDLTREQIIEGITEMVVSQEFDVIPESNQKVLPAEAWRVRFGGQLVDYLVRW